MATVTKKSSDRKYLTPGHSAIAGRKSIRSRPILQGYSSTGPCDGGATGDVVRFGILPAGIKISDALVIISDAFATSTTYKLGFAYVDGRRFHGGTAG